MVLQCPHAPASPAGLLKQGESQSQPRVSDSIGWEDPKICISNEFLGDVGAAGPGSTCGLHFNSEGSWRLGNLEESRSTGARGEVE